MERVRVYLDSSATTRPRPEVVELVEGMLKEGWGNPSSIHYWGERAALELEKARYRVASLIKAASLDSIIFTSGGTEADNLAIFGIAYQYRQPQHVIISAVEHPAVENPVAFLEKQGWEVTRLPVNRQGIVNPEDLLAALKENTVLVSIIYGQSEIGTLQPIPTLARITKQHSNAIFHTDAVQVVGRLPVDVEELGVDLLSLSGHKFYGIQGAGALYVKPGVKILPLLHGGGQESELRGGTQPLPAIVALGLAAEMAEKNMEEEMKRISQLRDYLIDSLEKRCPCLSLTGDRQRRLPHHASFLIRHPNQSLTGRQMVRLLSQKGIAISAGSACSSGKTVPSRVLLALGYSPQEAVRGIRISLDCYTTQSEIDYTVEAIETIMTSYGEG